MYGKLCTTFLAAALVLFSSQAPVHGAGNGRIAFSDREAQGRTQIFTILPDGANRQQLTTAGENSFPEWSSNGARLVFVSTRTGISELWTMDADGGNQTQLTFNTPGGNFTPEWSHDNSRIAYSSLRTAVGHPEVWVINSNRTNPQRLTVTPTSTTGPTWSLLPSWSPDGTKILFDTNRTSAPGVELWMMNADGTNAHLLTTGSGQSSWQPVMIACPGDANADNIVNFSDITSVLANWLGAGPKGDANEDGLVNFADITDVLANYSASARSAALDKLASRPNAPYRARIMNKRIALAIVLAISLSTVTHAERLILTGAHVLAPSADRWIDGQSIIIQDGRITTIAPASQLDRPANARLINLSGMYLIPGLIDLHTHLLLRPYDEESWNDQVLKDSHELRTIRGVIAARDTLHAGFTTIRDLGTEGAGYADVALKRAIDSGLIPGPRLFVATRAIVASGCYGPSGFAPHVTVPKGAQTADGVDGVRIAVRQQIAGGADWIKVYSDYRRAPGAPSTPCFTLEELQAIVTEAKSAGLPVAAHATTDEGIRRAVLAGASTIEHGYGASRATFELMRDRGTVLCPTLAAGDAVSRYAGWDGSDPPPARVTQAMKMFKLALDVGVPIACGGDAGVFSHGSNAYELDLMVQYGMTPEGALRSATLDAAAVLDMQGKLGVIAPGALADLVALSADPLKDISAIRDVEMVIARGQVGVSP